MNFIFILFPLLIDTDSDEVVLIKADTAQPCFCSWSYKLNFPKTASDKNISGKVVLEVKVDSSHYLSNPKVIKSLEINCDKEALRICNLIISQMNICQKRCGYNNNLKPGTIEQTISFESDE